MGRGGDSRNYADLGLAVDARESPGMGFCGLSADWTRPRRRERQPSPRRLPRFRPLRSFRSFGSTCIPVNVDSGERGLRSRAFRSTRPACHASPGCTLAVARVNATRLVPSARREHCVDRRGGHPRLAPLDSKPNHFFHRDARRAHQRHQRPIQAKIRARGTTSILFLSRHDVTPHSALGGAPRHRVVVGSHWDIQQP